MKEKIVETKLEAGGTTAPVTTSGAISSQFTSFAGIDIRVFVNGSSLPAIQAIDYTRYKMEQEWVADGEFVILLLNDPNPLPDHIESISVMAANEYDKMVIVFELEDVEIISVSSGVSVDDMVLEQSYKFHAKRFIKGHIIKDAPSMATFAKKFHVQRVKLAQSPLVAQAIEQTQDEPDSFLNDLTKLLMRYKINP